MSTDIDIPAYNSKTGPYQTICDDLNSLISLQLPAASSKIWHGHPVWFMNDNPIVGYSVRKAGVQLMFWSGRSFDDPALTGTSGFQDASVIYSDIAEINHTQVCEWLEKSKTIQWDYKNIVKKKGVLESLEIVSTA